MAERDARIDRLLLGQEIADFLYREAKMLDERRYRERLDLLAGDVRYWMPIPRNVKLGDDESEFTRALSDINWFDEGKDTLSRRVKQIETGNSLGRGAALAPLAPRHLRAGAGRRTFLCRTPNTALLPRQPRTMAVWHPLSPHQTECWRWFFVDSDAPTEVRRFLRDD